MRRIGIIDNLQDISSFIGEKYANASAADCMAVTGGNTGNVAFVHAARKIIGNSITRIDWNSGARAVRDRVDHIVICCANQIGNHVDLSGWADRIEQFERPVTLLGLGAQSDDIKTIPEIPVGTIKFLDLVKKFNYSSSPNIAVRGTFTQGVLAKNNVPSLALGCPSLHISPVHNLGASIFASQKYRKIKRVAVAAGNPWHGSSAFLEPVLVEIVNSYQGEYVIQHPESMLQAAFGEIELITPKMKSRFLEVYGEKFDFESLLEWFRRYSGVYIDSASWLRSMRRFDLAVGPRYHGIALAIQAGLPGCVITIDSRTQELCFGTGVKSVSIEDAKNLTANDLVEKARWTQQDADVFDYERNNKAIEYCIFLLTNGIQPSIHLKRNAGL